MNHLNNAHKNGGWVLLQNIHLTIDWTAGALEKKVDKLAENAHPDFRWMPSLHVVFKMQPILVLHHFGCRPPSS